MNDQNSTFCSSFEAKDTRYHISDYKLLTIKHKSWLDTSKMQLMSYQIDFPIFWHWAYLIKAFQTRVMRTKLDIHVFIMHIKQLNHRATFLHYCKTYKDILTLNLKNARNIIYNLYSYAYEKNFLSVMVNNSTNINKTNNHLSTQIIEHKNTMTITLEIKVLTWDKHKNVVGLYRIENHIYVILFINRWTIWHREHLR